MINRRQLLQTLGIGAVGASLTRTARADSGTPKRLLILSSGHGSVHDLWKMRFGGLTESGEGQADLRGLDASEFSHIFAPLHRHRSRLNLIEGLSLASAELDIAGYRHEKGWLHAWCGDWVYFPGSSLFSTTPSLDQIVAQQVARPDRLPSLELDLAAGRPISHAGKGQELPAEWDPSRVWQRLFGLSGSDDPLSAGQGSVLDFAKAEFDALTPRLSSEDQAKLSAHRELVNQLESRIRGMREASCPIAPEQPATLDDYDTLFQAQTELIAAAFSCDLTRVATLTLGDLPSEVFGWGWYLSGDAHNDFAHRLYIDEQAKQAMADYNRHHAMQVAALVDLLSSIPDSDGQTLMDNTLIVWGNEMADGWHGYMKYPAMMIGGSWAFETGRYIKYAYDRTPIGLQTENGLTESCGLPHQHLLTTVANAMGVATEGVGLRELVSTRGDRVTVTGGLPGVN